jgi:DNA-binding CsgD family transcriptional regulator
MKAAKSFETVLSAAEERVVKLVIQSMVNKEIAANLEISPATVKRHLEIFCASYERVIASKQRYTA